MSLESGARQWPIEPTGQQLADPADLTNCYGPVVAGVRLTLPGDGLGSRSSTLGAELTASSTGPTPTGGGRRLAILAVAVVVLLAGALRWAQADAYLPWQHHWDEQTNVRVGQRMVVDATPDPGFYDYPALVFLAQALVLVPATTIGDLDLSASEVMQVQTPGNARVQQPGVLLAMRWAVGVLPSLVTVIASAIIGWVATRRWWVATLASLVGALSVVDLRFGMFVTPDALSGAAATLATLGAVTITFRPTARRYMLTGAAIGLAAGAKYNAASVVIALLVAHLLVHRRPFAPRRLLAWAGASATAVFFLINISALLHPLSFFREVGSEGYHYSSGHFGNEGNSPLFHAGWLWQSFGFALVLAVVALFAQSQRCRHAAVVLSSFVVVYYVFISAFPVRFARNLLPITGSIAALAGLGVFALAERLVTRGHRQPSRVLVIAGLGAAAAVLAIPMVNVSAAVRSLGEDPWSDARGWLAGNVPDGATIAVEARSPYIDVARYHVVLTRSLGEHSLASYQTQGVEYFVAAKETFQPFLDDRDERPASTDLYRRLLSDGCTLHVTEGAGQRIVVSRIPPC
jgi:hypothetical protein